MTNANHIWQKITVALLPLLLIDVLVNAFNLENRLPIIKHGELDSYFGYSIAAHITLGQVDNETKW